MYKVLVVDDEALERDALKRIIEKQYPNRCAVTVAANGQEAISLSERLRVDIVLMDIEMPGISGLEAARIIKQMLPRCHVLIVTAYQRFQYVQEAMGIGADDYLLKPVSNQELFQKLEKLMAEVTQDRENLERHRLLDQLTKEQFVLSVISGYSSEAALKNQLKDLSISFSYGFFVILKGEKTHSAEKLAQMAEPFFPLFEGGSCLMYEYDEILLVAVIMLKPYEDAKWMLQQARGLLKRMETKRHERVMMGIGDVALTLPELRRSYETARKAIARANAAMPVVLGGERTATMGEGLEERLYHLLLEKDLDGAVNLINIILDTLTFGLAQPIEVAKAMEQLLGGVGERLAADMRLTESAYTDFSVFRLQNGSRAEWSMAARMFFSKWMKETEAQQGSHLQTVKQEIERYLHQNFTKDLSIGQASSDMHYSEAYFSKLFARCFQRNFISYLTEMRLKAAENMLLDQALSVREVGVAVGYADPNYFAKVFKKAYGISPSDYRRKRAARKEEGV